MTDRLSCVGGPRDGRDADAQDAHAYITPDGVAHRHPGPHRALYLRDHGRWVFAGHGAKICQCGTVVILAPINPCAACS